MTTTPPNEPGQPGPASQPAYPGSSAEQVGPGGYPRHPGTPPAGDPGQPGAEVPQPSSVRLAVRLMWAGAVLTALSVVVSLATLGTVKDDIEERLRADDPNVNQSTIDAAFAIGVIFAVGVGIIGVALWLWMAWKNGQGRSWARVVATVFAGLNVLFTFISLFQDTAPASRVISVVNVVLAIVILVLIWRKESSEFYAARSRPQLR